ncbi:MAG: zinc-ribbon domain-containing protein, partial [Gemmatimonadetes bacterium]|nr:zinc-ribbon domain-containing protein [Gemmatimonadota bacterium]
MNVHCTSCGTVYRVDPAKVSEAGVRARCTVCSNVIAITATGDRQPEVAPVLAAAPRRSQEQMAAQGLGDAFIPVPDDAQLSPPPAATPDVPPPVAPAPAPSAPVAPEPPPPVVAEPEPTPAVARESKPPVAALAPPVTAPVTAAAPPAARAAPPASGLRLAQPFAAPAGTAGPAAPPAASA